MELSRLAGNAALKATLGQQGIGRGLSHAYIISGPEGSGRHTLAELLAQAMVCSGDRGGAIPCGICPHCRKARAGIHPDIIHLGAAGEDIRVEAVRSLRTDAYIRPNEAQRKVYLLSGADTMNQSAQNALLKLLEEGPAYAAFLLIARHGGDLLQTVRSRCVELTLSPVTYGEAVEWLRRRFPDRDEGELARAAQACEGILGRGVEQLEGAQTDSGQARQLALDYTGLLTAGREMALMEFAIRLEGCGREELAAFYEELGLLLRDALVAQWIPPEEADPERRARGLDLSRALTRAQLMALSQLAAEGREGCDFHVGSGHSAGWLAARTWQLLTPQEVCDFPDAHRRG